MPSFTPVQATQKKREKETKNDIQIILPIKEAKIKIRAICLLASPFT